MPDVSEFAQQLKFAFERNTRPYIDPLLIFNEIRLGITKTTPLYGSLQGSAHQEGGSIIFFLKNPVSVASASEAPAAGFRIVRDIGTVRLSTYDSGKLYVDGVFAANVAANRSLSLEDVEAGNHTIEMHYESHIESFDIEVAKDSTVELSFVYERDPRFTLTVDPGIDRLSVFVDNQYIGVTPLSTELRAGKHQIKITGEWVEPIISEIFGETRTEKLFRPDVIEYGSLKIVGDVPSFATLFVDGHQISIADTMGSNVLKLSHGTHSVSISAPTIHPFVETVNIQSRHQFTLNLLPTYRTGSLKVGGITTEMPIRIGDMSYESVPENIDLIIGKYDIVVPNRFGDDFSGEVVILENENSEFIVPTGFLDVNGLDDRVMSVIIGDISLTRRELHTPIKLIAGEYRVSVPNQYGEEFSAMISVYEDKSTHYIVPVGNLIIEKLPENTLITINEVIAYRNIQATEEQQIPLLPGEYRVLITGQNASTDQFDIKISKNGGIVRKTSDLVFFGTLRIRWPKGRRDIDVVVTDNRDKRTTLTPRNTNEILPAGNYAINASFSDDVAVAYVRNVTVNRGGVVDIDLTELGYSSEYRIDELVENIEKAKLRASGGWTSVIAGVLFGASSIYLYFEGEEAMNLYQSATDASSAVAARSKVEQISLLFNLSTASALIGFILSPFLFPEANLVSNLEEQVRILQKETHNIGGSF